MTRYEFNVEDAKELYRDWVAKQSPEVRKMVGLISVDILLEQCKATKRGACTVAESFVGTSERTLRKWRGEFYAEGEIQRSARGGNLKNPLNGDIKKEVIEWLRRQTAKRNNRLTVSSFCRWLNNEFLPAHTQIQVDKVSRVTAWRWMYSLGFRFNNYRPFQ